MYNIFQKQIYIKHYNIIRALHGKLTGFIKCKNWWSHDFSPVVRTLTRRKRKRDKITFFIFRFFLFDLIKFDIFHFGRHSLFHFQNDNFVHHCEL